MDNSIHTIHIFSIPVVYILYDSHFLYTCIYYTIHIFSIPVYITRFTFSLYLYISHDSHFLYTCIYHMIHIFSIPVYITRFTFSLYLYISHDSHFLYTCIYHTGYGVLRHFQQYFSYIVAVSFIGGGNPST